MRILLAGSPLLLLAFVLFLARSRAEDAPLEPALGARLPTVDLAWITLSRAARSPSTEETRAPESDNPTAVDADPASGTLFLGETQ